MKKSVIILLILAATALALVECRQTLAVPLKEGCVYSVVDDTGSFYLVKLVHRYREGYTFHWYVKQFQSPPTEADVAKLLPHEPGEFANLDEAEFLKRLPLFVVNSPVSTEERQDFEGWRAIW